MSMATCRQRICRSILRRWSKVGLLSICLEMQYLRSIAFDAILSRAAWIEVRRPCLRRSMTLLTFELDTAIHRRIGCLVREEAVTEKELRRMEMYYLVMESGSQRPA